jgi:hypothetical protein
VPDEQPDALANWLGHLVVGLGVLWIATKLFHRPAIGLAFGVAAGVAHQALDAPLAQVLSELGI